MPYFTVSNACVAKDHSSFFAQTSRKKHRISSRLLSSEKRKNFIRVSCFFCMQRIDCLSSKDKKFFHCAINKEGIFFSDTCLLKVFRRNDEHDQQNFEGHCIKKHLLRQRVCRFKRGQENEKPHEVAIQNDDFRQHALQEDFKIGAIASFVGFGKPGSRTAGR